MRRLPVLLVAAAVFVAVSCGSAAAATYYVSPSGSDSSAGTSASAAWKTVGKVNRAALVAGDTVLFQGGSTFSDAPLMPGASGAAGSPITFGSYGSGLATISYADGAVWFSGKHYLTFDGLDLTTGGANNGVFAGSTGGGSDHIVLQNSVVENSGGAGVISPGPADSAWTIQNDTFRNLGDSALILLGSSIVVSGNTISHVGVNSAITYGKHGVYSKGPDQTITGNDISDVTGGQAVSIRFHGARVYGNTIHDTAYGFGFFDYDTAAAPQGTSYVYDNRLWNISGWGFYYDGQLDPNGVAPSVDFVVASNTFSFSSAQAAVNVGPSGSAHVTFVNNIFGGTYGSAFQGATTTVENHNDWFGGSTNIPHGAGDSAAAPGLSAAPTLGLPGGSPLVDAGVTVSSLAYAPTCNGAALSYCGTAPDLGAVEASALPVLQPLAPPTGVVATNVGPTSASLQWTPSADSRTIGYRVSLNGNVAATPSGPSAALASLTCATTYAVSVVAVDTTSATSTAATTSFTTAACPAPAPPPTPTPPPAPVQPPDTTPPALAITSPAANASVPLSLAVTATATDASGVASVTFTVDGATRCTVTAAPYACAVSVGRGYHTLGIQATDTKGNASTASIRVYAKRLRTLAQVVAASPASGASVASSFVVRASAVAPTGGSVVFRLDGRARCVDHTAPYACRFNAARGWHVVAVRAGTTNPVQLQLHVG